MEEPGQLVWWPSVVAVQAEAANRPQLLRSRAVVVSVGEKVAPLSAAGVDHEGERKRTTDDVSKDYRWHRNRGCFAAPG
jgi:hypothetical protein